MELAFLLDTTERLLSGIPLLLQLWALSVAVGAVLAVGIALLRMSGIKPLEWAASFYVFVFRGTPLLVQMFLIYYGLSLFGLRLDGVWMHVGTPEAIKAAEDAIVASVA